MHGRSPPGRKSYDTCYMLPNFHSMFFDRYWSHVQDLQDFVRRIFIIFGARLFQDCQNFGCRQLRYLQNIFSTNVPGISLLVFRYPGVSKNKHNWFWGLVTGSNIPKSYKWGFWVSPISKSKSYYTKSKQNHPPELLNILFL